MAIPRLLTCDVQKFLTATLMAHLALWGKPVGDIDDRRFLLDLHHRLGRRHCFPKTFGLGLHSNTTNGSDFTAKPYSRSGGGGVARGVGLRGVIKIVKKFVLYPFRKRGLPLV